MAHKNIDIDHRFRTTESVTVLDPVNPDIDTLSSDFLSLLDAYELSDAYSCSVEPACPGGGITFDQETGVIDATDLGMDCR